MTLLDAGFARRRTAYLLGLLVLGVVGLFLFRVADRFAGAGHDDAFITLLAAKQLASGEGFLSADGKPGEIGSSLLHVLLLAVLDKVGVADLYLVNKLIGVTCGAVTLGLVLVRGARKGGDEVAAVDATALATVAAIVPVALPTYLFWSAGGLETPIVGLLLTAFAFALDRAPARRLRIGLLGLGLITARPEGFVYLAPIVLAGLVPRRDRRWWGIALGVPAAGLFLVTLFRWVKFGALVPLPVLAKAGSPLTKLGEGLHYLMAFGAASSLGFVLLVGVVVRVGIAGWRFARARTVPEVGVAAVVLTHLSAVALSGGDWMAFYRFVAPVIPLLGVVAADLLGMALRRAASRWFVVPLATVLVAMAVLILGSGERSGLHPPYMRSTCRQRSLADLANPELGDTLGERVRVLNHPFLRDTLELDPFLRGPLRQVLASQESVVIASYQMGFLPYRVRELGLVGVHFVDTVGIVDSVLGRLPGTRTPHGLEAGLEPTAFLDPASSEPLAQAVLARQPEVVYVLRADKSAIRQLAKWGWRLLIAQPEAKIFVRAEAYARWAAAVEAVSPSGE